ncbi:MAG: DUF4295 domain-containing protein [Bacteroidia bacterium]|nr:DUF4295 domain-containing protein [Bacteroidia bacterium]MCX7764901.1 DUF4295 domain-containing protein [Bacteroidia bacterium]MDW8057545.1 DUF4295 family protein [Bacteroidia bacterium]
MAKKTVATFRSGDRKAGLTRVIYPVKDAQGRTRFHKKLISSDQLQSFLAQRQK